MSAFLGVPADAAYHLVYALTNLLTPVLGGLAAVAAIIVFTAAVRLAVMPLSFRALRGQATQARLAPQVTALRERYRREPERFQRELAELYRREGTSVFAGFGPLLAQWPVFSVLYLLFRSPVVAGGPNRLLSRELSGVPLGGHWLGAAGGAFGAHGAVFLGVFAVLAVICWLSSRVARHMSAVLAAPAAGRRAGKSAAARPADRPAAVAAAAPGSGALGALGVLGKVLPYITIVIAAFAPLAAGIYLVTSTAWSVAERWVFSRSGRDRNDRRDPDAGVPVSAAGPPTRRRA
jgi:YidC/Oxa1 family membrane protein insertase